jgi:peptidoglycan/xylan/chitin deacetylase (PgdA/CDA1 family)
MDDGHSDGEVMTTTGAGTPMPAPVRQEVTTRSWSREPHHQHRRRRAVALLGAGLVLGLVAVLLSSGGSAVRASAPGHGQAGFFRQVQTLAGSGAQSLAARELAVQNAAIDRTLGYTPYVRIAGSQHREVALTFDDGPGPYTPEIMAVLGQDNVPATFFEVGVEEHFFHAATSEIVAAGDPIGDHTFSHRDMSTLNRAGQRAQLLHQIKAIRAYGAAYPRLFRPPYGMWNRTTLSLLHQYHMLMVLWSVDTSDYRLPGVQAIVKAVVNGAKPGAIILLHDAGGNRAQTVQALPKIIAALRHRGYRLVTVPQLLVDNPPPADQQISAAIGSGG